MISRIVKCKIL